MASPAWIGLGWAKPSATENFMLSWVVDQPLVTPITPVVRGAGADSLALERDERDVLDIISIIIASGVLHGKR